jgi:hypothetical protein
VRGAAAAALAPPPPPPPLLPPMGVSCVRLGAGPAEGHMGGRGGAGACRARAGGVGY